MADTYGISAERIRGEDTKADFRFWTQLSLLADNKNVVQITPRSGGIFPSLAEVIAYRELLVLLVAREIRAKYRQSVLGPVWAIIQPVLTMVVFTVLFGLLMGDRGMPSPDGIPYAISTYCALVPWQLFMKGASNASGSIVKFGPMITKVYFPRVIVPLSALCGALVEFVLAFFVLILMMIGFGVMPTVNIVFLPVFVLLAFGAAFAVGLWFCGLNALVRDVSFGLPALLQIAMYATPVVYSASAIVPSIEERVGSWAVAVFWLNPMVGVVEGFRWALLDSAAPPFGLVLTSAVIVLLAVLSGAMVFRRFESLFSDLV